MVDLSLEKNTLATKSKNPSQESAFNKVYLDTAVVALSCLWNGSSYPQNSHCRFFWRSFQSWKPWKWMRIDNKCDDRAGESMVMVCVWRDLHLLGGIMGSSFKAFQQHRGEERFVGLVGAASTGAAWGEEQRSRQADNPGSNPTFVKGEILKRFCRVTFSVWTECRHVAEQAGAGDVTARQQWLWVL